MCEASLLHREYYHNVASGVAQWEHPQHSFLTGITNRLLMWGESNPTHNTAAMARAQPTSRVVR